MDGEPFLLYGRETMFNAEDSISTSAGESSAEMAAASASTSDVLSHALGIRLDISGVTPAGNNEKPAFPSSAAAARSWSTRRSPTNSPTMSFPTKAMPYVPAPSSSADQRPKLARFNSIDSCSTATTVGTSASFASSSAGSGSPPRAFSPVVAASPPKRSIFQSYWDKNGISNNKSKGEEETTTTTSSFIFSNLPKDCSTSGLHPSTLDGDGNGSTASSATNEQATAESSAADPPTNADANDDTTDTDDRAASPKRSIFGDGAMEMAKQSSLPDLPSIAATLISESTYTDYHRIHEVRKTSSTEYLVKRRKSCLRRVALYSGPGPDHMRKSASTTTCAPVTTTTSIRTRTNSATITPTSNSTARPTLLRPRASTEPVVQFDPEVKVYEFHRTAFVGGGGGSSHPNSNGSNDWSHLFA